MKEVASKESSQLRDLQRAFARFVFEELTDQQRIKPTDSAGQNTAELAASLVKPDSRLTSLERVEIYNRQYWFRLIDCIYEDFPGVHALLGDDLFYQTVIDYLKIYPSRSYTLRDLGINFSAFLLSNCDSREIFTAAAQLASLEWAQIVAFDAAHHEPLQQTDLVNQDISALTLNLQPHITLLRLDYPFDDFVLALRNGRLDQITKSYSEASTGQLEATAVTQRMLPEREDVYLAVHRVEFTVYYKRLRDYEFRILSEIRDHKVISQIFASPELSAIDPVSVQSSFAEWQSLGWFYQEKNIS